MSCAHCEEADATVRCEDEDLEFCLPCSTQLHGKKARQHHQVTRLMPVAICDECEVASAKVKCEDCGGGRNGTALVFCVACSVSLHSRAARAGHHIVLIQRQKQGGAHCSAARRIDVLKNTVREKSSGGRIVIDLTDCEDLEGEENQTTADLDRNQEDKRKLFGNVRVKEEKREDNSMKKSRGKEAREESSARKARVKEEPTDEYTARDVSGKKCPNNKNTVEKMSSQIPCLTNLTNKKCFKEEKGRSPEKSKTRSRIRGHSKTASAKKEPQSSCSGFDSDNPTDSEINESDEEYGGVHRIKRGSVSVEAFVVDADDEEEAGPSGAIPEERVEAGIKDRIKKMLDLGLHPDTPEIEAQQALKNAQRLLTKHNLEQAEVLKGNLTDTSSLIGGMRVVELRTKGKTKQGRMEAWVQELGWVIADNFDCQYFFKTGNLLKPLRVVFYGISHNAECAGYAFAATFNRITLMSAAYIATQTFEDDKENQCGKLRQVSQSTFTRVARTNYRKGIVAGLKEAVKSAQKMRKEIVTRHERKQQEEHEHQPGVENYSDSDDYSTCEDEEDTPKDWRNKCDLFDTKTREVERSMAITALVMHSQKVGEEFLFQKGIKLRKRAPPNRQTAWNEEAFAQGKKDAKSIDINQRGITGSKVKKPRA